MEAVAAIKRRFELLAPVLNERTRRLVAAAEAVAYGRGGGMAVASPGRDVPLHLSGDCWPSTP